MITFPYHDDVSLVLHFDHTAGTTPVEEVHGKVVSVYGTATISNARAKWGQGSLITPSTGSELRIPIDGDISVAPGLPWTAEAWIYLTSHGKEQAVFACQPVAWYAPELRISASGDVSLNRQNWGQEAYWGGSLSLHSWHHLAWVFNGTRSHLFIDGIQTSPNGDYSFGFFSYGAYNYSALSIGGTGESSSFNFSGNIGYFRLAKAALYSGNFTPPSIEPGVWEVRGQLDVRGVPGARRVGVFRRSDGQLMDQAMSEVDGSFLIELEERSLVQVVAFPDWADAAQAKLVDRYQPVRTQ